MENLQTGVERKRAKRPSLAVGFAHGQSEILDA